MNIILTKVVSTSRYELDKPEVPQFATYSEKRFSLYLPEGTNITARLRLIQEYRRRGYKLEWIGWRAWYANFTK